MKRKMRTKLMIIGISFLLIGIVSSLCTADYQLQNRNSYTNLTVQETWDLLSDTANGIQIPIDVRRDDEWKVEHIDTAAPENPIHYPLSDLENPIGLQTFFSLFEGNEIILYCRTGSRSVTAANILIDNGFNGTIYNMLGGITAWKAAGLPIHANQIPSVPVIDGPAKGKPGTTLSYTIQSVDPDGDELYYCINWSDGTDEICIGPYLSGEVVEVSHSWRVKALDRYDDESDWGTLEVQMPHFYRIELWQWLAHQFPIVSYLFNLLFY
jgi:rhodanese-related sulfurtransferase